MPLSSSLEALKLKSTAAEHRGGEGVACELFELGLENFVVRNLTMVFPGVCGTDLFSYPFLADPRPLMILKFGVPCSNSSTCMYINAVQNTKNKLPRALL